MDKSQVLIILDDEWMSAVLERYLSSAGFMVHQSSEARAGVRAAQELVPDCIICDEELPDIDGFWVVQRVRAAKSRVSSVPILLLTEDLEALQKTNLGVDLFLKKPLNTDEVAAQVRALLNMAQRLRKRGDSGAPPPASSLQDGKAALRGDIAQMSVTTVMTLLEMERRTGELTVERKAGEHAQFELSEGALVGVRVGGKSVPPLGGMRTVLGWGAGRFSFSPCAGKGAPSENRHSLGMLLLEAARIEDEGGGH